MFHGHVTDAAVFPSMYGHIRTCRPVHGKHFFAVFPDPSSLPRRTQARGTPIRAPAGPNPCIQRAAGPPPYSLRCDHSACSLRCDRSTRASCGERRIDDLRPRYFRKIFRFKHVVGPIRRSSLTNTQSLIPATEGGRRTDVQRARWREAQEKMARMAACRCPGAPPDAHVGARHLPAARIAAGHHDPGGRPPRARPAPGRPSQRRPGRRPRRRPRPARLRETPRHPAPPAAGHLGAQRRRLRPRPAPHRDRQRALTLRERLRPRTRPRHRRLRRAPLRRQVVGSCCTRCAALTSLRPTGRTSRSCSRRVSPACSPGAPAASSACSATMAHRPPGVPLDVRTLWDRLDHDPRSAPAAMLAASRGHQGKGRP